MVPVVSAARQHGQRDCQLKHAIVGDGWLEEGRRGAERTSAVSSDAAKAARISPAGAKETSRELHRAYPRRSQETHAHRARRAERVGARPTHTLAERGREHVADDCDALGERGAHGCGLQAQRSNAS